MFDVTLGPARKALLARDPDTLAESLDHEDLIAVDRGPLTPAPGSGTIVIDANRRRPLYFDGRFLAARDLTREQEYFLTRQADLNRAGGMGVVAGLRVKPGQTATAIRIEPGHGATPSGALVLISDEIEIDLADVTATQRLDAAFGLSKIPSTPARSRSGLFIVALRPVEFTANRIAAYPTSIMEQRSTEYGDIVEATAVTLIPYEDQGGRVELDQRRARAAREIFLLNNGRGVPADALPLAIIALDRGVQRWIDPYLVRREVGAQHGDMLGLTTVSRAQREAFLLQYDLHLQDVLNQRRASNATWRFPATAHFQALPPAGRLPAAAVDGNDFTQVFFPAQVEAELSFVAEDEVRPMLDEAMLLPPIDLTASGESLESTSVLVMIPVSRQRLRTLQATLNSISRTLPAATPNAITRSHPLNVLRLRLPPRIPIVPLPNPEELAEQAWREALANTDLLWYMRRRNLSYRADLTGLPVAVRGNELALDRDVTDRLGGLGLLDRYLTLRGRATSGGLRVLTAALSAPKVAASPLLTEAVITQLEGAEGLDSGAALRATELFQDPKFGDGIARIETARPDLRTGDTVKRLLDTGALRDLDRLGSSVADDIKLRDAAGAVVAVATSNKRDRAAKLAAINKVVAALGTERVQGSALLTDAALTRLNETPTADAEAIQNVTTTFADPRLGEGIKRIEQEHPEVTDTQVVKALAETGALNDLDRLGAAVSDRQTLKAVTDEVVVLAKSNDPDRAAKIKSLVTGKLNLLPRR